MPQPVWTGFVANASLRALAARDDQAVSAITKKVRRELEALPANTLITKTYCTRFAGVLNLDGVYVKVKGYPRAVPFLYGIDFETHDIPAGMLALAENEGAFERFFEMLKEAGYPLRLVVADEASALKPALARIFPDVRVQLCQVHILRNIRMVLHLSMHDQTHAPFFRRIQILFNLSGEANRQRFFQDIASVYDRDPRYWDILRTILARWDDLFRFESVRKEGIRCPRTNNLIEAYNSHFKARVRAIKGFESFSSASRFLNGWMLKRRFTPFQGCGKPFEHLNGYSSFEKSRNPNLPWPEIYGLAPPKIPTRK